MGASGWAADVDTFLAALETIHPDPHHSASREEFVAAVVGFKSQLPELTEWQAVAGFQRLLAMLTRNGRDGHMFLRPESREEWPWRVLPIQLYWFDDGFYVVDARPPFRHLIGARLMTIGSNDISEIVDDVELLVTKDNAMTVRARVPAALEMVDLVASLGLIDPDEPVLGFEMKGRRFEVTMPTITYEDHARWSDSIYPYVRRLPTARRPLYLRHVAHSIWIEYLARSRTIYFAFNFVRGPLAPAAAELTRLIRAHPDARVVIDLRHNPGGNTESYPPLLDALSAPEVDRPGRLYALTSRVTFSAAANFLADLDRATCVVVVGEPPGAAPRFFSDTVAVPLPYSGLEVDVPTRYWDKGEEEGTLFEVDVDVGYTSGDYFAHRDPVLNRAVKLDERDCRSS